jgi:hypothetical protein
MTELNPYWIQDDTGFTGDTASPLLTRAQTKPQIAPTGSGRLRGNAMTTPEQQMTYGAIQTGGNILATGIGAYMQSKENEKAIEESEQLAEQSRQDRLKQQKVDNSINQRLFEQEQKEFELQKNKEKFDLRYNRWINKINKAIESRNKITEVAKSFANILRGSELHDVLLKEFGGK